MKSTATGKAMENQTIIDEQTMTKQSHGRTEPMKNRLLQMARSGEKKPSRNSKEARCLANYTKEKRGSYDPVFTAKLKEIAPHWLIKSSVLMKERLLTMAKNKESRPDYHSKEGHALRGYILASKNTYDEIFTEQIKKLAPEWFRSWDQRPSKTIKERLLQMAEQKLQRPTHLSQEGRRLSDYICKTSQCHDPLFTEKIKEIAPHWFEKSSDLMKERLLQMARSGEEKPKQTTNEGANLYGYTTEHRGTFDPVFTFKIRKIAPHWFEKKAKARKIRKHAKQN